VNFEASPLSGLLRPVAGPVPSGSWTDAGLLVPDLSDTAARFGLVPTGASSAWFDEYVKQYLTTADYLRVPQAAGLQVDPASLIRGLLLLHPREVYLAVLTALNHAAHYPELADVYRDRFLARLNDAMADSVRQALDGTMNGVPRALLARQPVLRAMRTVLTYRRPEGAPSASDMSKLAPGLDPELAGILLVHLTAAQLRSPSTASEPKIGALPASLAMEMVANGLFHSGEQPDVLLARTRTLWTTYGSQIDLDQLKLRAQPLDLLRDATRLDYDDIAALSFAYHGYIRAHQPGQPPGVNAFTGIPIDRDTIETYLASFASTMDELAGKLDACPGSWQMLPIQERPLLRIGDVLLVLDEQYLIERATQGLYWFVHEKERELDGTPGWTRWNNAYANMVERRVEDQLRRMTPPLLGSGSLFFTEENLRAAFPGRKNADAGINYGSLVLLAEVVTTQVALNTRENADTAAYSKDIDKFFLKKADQLDETATDLLRDPQPAASPLDQPAERILPVAVRGGQFPVNPVTREHIEAALKNAKLLNYSSPSAPIFPFAPVDLGELEMCETLRETRGLSLPDLIRRWQASEEYARSSLRNFLINTYSEDSFPRPADLRAELARTLSLIAARLGSDWTPPDDLNPGQRPERAG
jgi:hypothetical protein